MARRRSPRRALHPAMLRGRQLSAHPQESRSDHGCGGPSRVQSSHEQHSRRAEPTRESPQVLAWSNGPHEGRGIPRLASRRRAANPEGRAPKLSRTQTDLTRVSTFTLARELSGRAYPEIGISDSHHPVSHHRNNATDIEPLSKIRQPSGTDRLARHAAWKDGADDRRRAFGFGPRGTHTPACVSPPVWRAKSTCALRCSPEPRGQRARRA